MAKFHVTLEIDADTMTEARDDAEVIAGSGRALVVSVCQPTLEKIVGLDDEDYPFQVEAGFVAEERNSSVYFRRLQRGEAEEPNIPEGIYSPR